MRSILICLALVAPTLAAPADLLSFEEAKHYFLVHRTVLEETVHDVRKCPGLGQIRAARSSANPLLKCSDGNTLIPKRVSASLASVNTLWANVTWGTPGETHWDPAHFYAVAFVLQSEGLLTHGFGAQIVYFEEALRPMAIADNLRPLTKLPAHWAYQATSN